MLNSVDLHLLGLIIYSVEDTPITHADTIGGLGFCWSC